MRILVQEEITDEEVEQAPAGSAAIFSHPAFGGISATKDLNGDWAITYINTSHRLSTVRLPDFSGYPLHQRLIMVMGDRIT